MSAVYLGIGIYLGIVCFLGALLMETAFGGRPTVETSVIAMMLAISVALTWPILAVLAVIWVTLFLIAAVVDVVARELS